MDLTAFVSSLLIIAAIALVDIGAVEASIHTYDREVFKEIGNAYVVSGGSEGIVASAGDGPSFIWFENMTFWRSKEAAELNSSMEHSIGLIQAIIFETSDPDNIGGSAYGVQGSICCTPDLAKLEGCKQGEVIRRPSYVDLNWPVVLSTHFSANYSFPKMDPQEVYVSKTGKYDLFFISCDPKLRGLMMSGKTFWKNPGGYLTGGIAPLMTFYIFMPLAYLMLSVIWFVQYTRFWRDIRPIQNCITAVIVLCLFEMTLKYFVYLNFNRTGMKYVGITTWAVATVEALRRTVLTLFICSVCAGYGVVQPTLGGLTSRVLLGVTLFLVMELVAIADIVGITDDILGKAIISYALLVVFLMVVIIFWAIASLYRTLLKLQVRESYVELDIYRKFTNALVVFWFASVAMTWFEAIFEYTDLLREWWRIEWTIVALWNVMIFAFLCLLAYLWAPSSRSSLRYTYLSQADEETQLLKKKNPCDAFWFMILMKISMERCRFFQHEILG